MLAIIGGAMALVAGSVLVGRCLLRLLGIEGPAPAVGLAVLVILADATLTLDADGAVAGVVLGAITAAALIAEVMGRERPRPVVLAGGVVTGLLALSIGLIPFAVNARAGTLGVSILNDLAIHEYWAWALTSGHVYRDLIFPGYPLGAHALAGTLAVLTGTSTERSFAALLIATPCLTALTAFVAFDSARLWLRSLGASIAAFPYLGAAFLGEGAFKEPMVVLLVLGVALQLRSLSRDAQSPIARCAVIGVLIAATALIEGGPGLAWPGLTIAIWAVYELVTRHRHLQELARSSLVPIAAGGVLVVILVVPELGSLLRFSPNLQGSNLPGYLPFGESMALWFAPDFRLAHSTELPETVLVLIGLALLTYACWWWARRREVSLPAAALAALIVMLYVHHHSNAYLTAKSQMIFGGLYMVTVVGPLLNLMPTCAAMLDVLHGRGSRLLAAAGAAGTLVLAGFVVGVARSDSLSLRDALVDADAHTSELAPIRAAVQGKPTLMLVTADFGPWELRGARQSVLTSYGIADREPIVLDPESPVPTSGDATGFASVTSSTLNRFRFAVTTSSDYTSSPPSNWHRVMSTRSYTLWRRAGSTPTMTAVPGATTPISQLACSTPAVRTLLNGRNAVVRPAPVIGPPSAWRLADGAGLAFSALFAAIDTGATVSQTLTLPAGRWNISLPYQSSVPITVRFGGQTTTLPANLDVFGSYWTIGDVGGSGGPLTVSLHLARRPFPGIQMVEPVGSLAAVRMGVPPRRLPVRRACGRWVDWLTGSATR